MFWGSALIKIQPDFFLSQHVGIRLGSTKPIAITKRTFDRIRSHGSEFVDSHNGEPGKGVSVLQVS